MSKLLNSGGRVSAKDALKKAVLEIWEESAALDINKNHKKISFEDKMKFHINRYEMLRLNNHDSAVFHLNIYICFMEEIIKEKYCE